jgi:predicted RNA-binding Zn-ribbon protein involved in translation (DUF1610 family)
MIGGNKIMEKLTGQLDFSVSVDCPECGADLDIETFDDDENKLNRALFGEVNKPAKWDNIGAIYECPECGEKFVLDKIEY